MDKKLKKSFEDAIWVSKSLFNRNKTTGSSANISFLYNKEVYISKSNSCFGNLDINDFAKIDLKGNNLNGIIPSKELRLHLALYNKKDSKINSVIHTHSTFSVLWSMLEHSDTTNIIPCYTPYLSMKLENIVLIEYYTPGSEELFQSFEERVVISNGFILKNHGPIVGADCIWSSFCALEELEESAKIAWMLRNEGVQELTLK